MLHRNKRFSVKVCYGWGRLSSSATILFLLTREILLFTYIFYVVGLTIFGVLSSMSSIANWSSTVHSPGKTLIFSDRKRIH